MMISELFISLGVRGTEKTIGALTNVESGLEGIIKASLAATAAILTAVYSLDKLKASAADSVHLENLSTYIGMSVKELQQWQYAFQQGKVSTQEFEHDVSSLYETLKKIRTEGGYPKAFAQFSQQVGGFDKEKAQNNLGYALEKIIQFAKTNYYDRMQKEDILQKVTGFDNNTIAALLRGEISPNIGKNPFVNENTIKTLSDLDVKFSNLETRAKNFLMTLEAKHGLAVYHFFDDLLTKVMNVTKAIEDLTTKLETFLKKFGFDKFVSGESPIDFQNRIKNLSPEKKQEELDKYYKKIQEKDDKFLDNLGKKLNPLINSLEEKFINDNDTFSSDEGESVFESISKWYKDINDKYKFTLPNIEFSDFFKSNTSRFSLEENPPSIPSRFGLGTQNQNNNINQNIYFQNDNENIRDKIDPLYRAIGTTIKQLSAQSQVT